MTNDADQDKIEIRCSHGTKVGFKKISAEFDDYEHLIQWLIENFQDFRALRSVTTTKKIRIKHGVL